MNTLGIFEYFFDGNPYLNAISFLLAILGVIFTVYFYIKSKKIRKPIYMLRTVNLVRENIQKIVKINILYNGKAINNLSITKIALWNGGKETIDNNDVARKNPLRLSIKNDCMFLDAEIIYQKNTSNGFNISISDDHKYIDITFDYFDFEEGIVLQVFHTGNKSDDITLIGQIKSVKQIQRGNTTHSLFPLPFIDILQQAAIPHKQKQLYGDWLIFIIGILSVCLSIIFMFVRIDFLRSDPEVDRITLIISLGAIGLLYLFMGYRGIKRHIPKGFDVFNEEFLREEKVKESE